MEVYFMLHWKRADLEKKYFRPTVVLKLY